jgi:heme A synthase
MVIGMTGSLASLGDTIFPSDSLWHAVQQDFSSSGHILLRLRVLHPIGAVIGSAYVLWLVHAFWQKQDRFVLASLLTFALTAQIVLGAMNVIFLAPDWLQLTHLFVAEVFWILLVLASADQLFANHHAGVLLARKETIAANCVPGLSLSDYISRDAGPSV